MRYFSSILMKCVLIWSTGLFSKAKRKFDTFQMTKTFMFFTCDATMENFHSINTQKPRWWYTWKHVLMILCTKTNYKCAGFTNFVTIYFFFSILFKSFAECKWTWCFSRCLRKHTHTRREQIIVWMTNEIEKKEREKEERSLMIIFRFGAWCVLDFKATCSHTPCDITIIKSSQSFVYFRKISLLVYVEPTSVFLFLFLFILFLRWKKMK